MLMAKDQTLGRRACRGAASVLRWKRSDPPCGETARVARTSGVGASARRRGAAAPAARATLLAGVVMAAVAAGPGHDAARDSPAGGRGRACGAPAGAFTIAICGNRFVNQAGRTVVLRGVNTEGTQYDCAQQGAGFFDDPTMGGGDYSASIQAMRSWGVNVVRVNLNEECWLGINGVPSTTSAVSGAPPSGDRYDRTVNAYMRAIGSYVAALNHARIYAELDLHLNAPGGELIADAGDQDAQNPLPESNSDRFWKSVASYFSRDHAVIFGVFNEPFPPDAEGSGDTAAGWACDVDGCTVPDYTDLSSGQYGDETPSTTYTGEGMKAMIADIRAYDRAVPLLVAGPDFAGDTDRWLAAFRTGGASLDPSNELGASVHVYFPAGNSPCADSDEVTVACGGNVPRIAAVAPVVLDEVGDVGCARPDLFRFLRSVDAEDAAAKLDIGYLGWAWTTYRCDPNLITSWTTGAPSPMGEAECCELLDIGVAPQRIASFPPGDYCSGSVPDATPRT
jgi:endoglucanase